MHNFNKNHSRLLFLSLLLIIGIISTSIILLATRTFGVGLSPDSLHYLFMAKQVLIGEAITTAVWPPMYPAALALISLIFRISLLNSARFLNAVSFGITIFMSGILIRKNIKLNMLFTFLGLFIIILSRPLVPVHLMAWSEPLFICMMIISLLFLDEYFSVKNFSYLILSSVFISIACITRYIGLAVVMAAISTIVLLNRQNYRLLIRDVVSYLLISTTPLAVWLVRNICVTGTLTGPRSSSSHTFLEIIRAMSNAIYRFFLFGRLENNRLLIAIFFIIIGFLISTYYWKIYQIYRPDLSRNYLFIIVIGVYLVFLLSMSMLTKIDLVDNRLLSPIIVPLYLIFLGFTIEIGKIWKEKKHNISINIFLTLFLTIFIIFSFPYTKATINNHIKNGNDFLTRPWSESIPPLYYEEFPDL